MTCEELIRLLPDYLEDEVKAELCRELEEHMRVCDYCRGNVHTMRGTVALTHYLGGPVTHSGPGTHAAWVARLRERVIGGPGSDPGPSAG